MSRWPVAGPSRYWLLASRTSSRAPPLKQCNHCWSDSSVRIATRYRLDGPGFESRKGQKIFLHNAKTGSGAHPASYLFVYLLYLMFVVPYVYLLYYVCIVTLHAGRLARSQNPEGPATGHLDTGFSWFPCVYKRMLRWFPGFQVATTCLSCSPPDLNFLVTFCSCLCTCQITTAAGW